MADRYWVGGTAAWDATAGSKWALTSGGAGGQAVPTASDDVYFDANSGAVTVTISANQSCRSLDCNGVVAGFTIVHNSSVTVTIGTTTARADAISLRLVSGMTYTLGSSSSSRFSFNNGPGTPVTIDTAGKTTGDMVFGGNNTGSWKLLGNLFGATQATITHTRGTLDSNGFAVSYGFYQRNNSNTCVLTLGSSAWTIKAAVANAFQTTATGLTVTANTATITLTGNGGTNTLLATGGVNFNGATFVISGSGNQGVQAFTAKALTRTGTAVTTDGLVLAGDITVDTLTLTGNSPTNSLTITGTTSTRTIHVLIGPASITNAVISTLAALDQHVAFRDALGMVDSAAKARTVPLTEAFGAVDAVAQTATAARTVTDPLGMVDAAAAQRALARAPVDTFGMVDGAAQALTLSRTVTDPLGMVDAVALAPTRVITDTLALTDTTDATLTAGGLTQDLLDSFGLTDSATRTATAGRAILDSLPLSDVAGRAFAATRSRVDAFDTTDGVVQTSAAARAVIDSLGLTDRVGQARRYVIVDGLDLADAATDGITRRRQITDHVGLADTVTYGQTLARVIHDVLAAADLVTRTATLYYSVADTFGAVDGLVVALRRVYAILDHLTVLDGAQVALRRVHAVIDALGLADHITVTQVVVPELGARITFGYATPAVRIDLPLVDVTFVGLPGATVTFDLQPEEPA